MLLINDMSAIPGCMAKDYPRQLFVDVHCHCLPDLDDGPRGMTEALALCRALVSDGIGTVVATPHQLGLYDGRYGGDVLRNAVAQLNRILSEAGIPLVVLPGADIRLDERIDALLQNDDILTLADGGRYLLIELPHEVFIDPEILLIQLHDMGIYAVIFHPERHAFLTQNPSYIHQWLDYDPCLQITASSFIGDFGHVSEKAAWDFVHVPLPVLVATDAHNTGKKAPKMTIAHRKLAERFGHSTADILCIENPRSLVAGEDLLMLNDLGENNLE